MRRSKNNVSFTKSNSLQQISIEDLNENINVLKERVTSQSNIMEISMLNAGIQDLKEASNAMKNIVEDSQAHIKELQETVVNQNKVIVGLVSDIKVMVKSCILPGQVSAKYSDLFPINSEPELVEIEDEITDDTKFSMMATIKTILNPGGLNKNLVNIMNYDILLQYNVDGKQGKKRILDYPKFVEAIHKALYYEGYSRTIFLRELRKAFRLTKNRHYKDACLKKTNAEKITSEESEECNENQPP